MWQYEKNEEAMMRTPKREDLRSKIYPALVGCTCFPHTDKLLLPKIYWHESLSPFVLCPVIVRYRLKHMMLPASFL